MFNISTNKFNQDNYEKLRYKLGVAVETKNLYMSNRYFEILLELKNNKKLQAIHISFTYAYLYFETYMYRYTCYNSWIPKVSEIKEVLGYSSCDKRLNYIIKENGLLDLEKITITDRNYPIAHFVSSFNEIEFQTLESIDEEMQTAYDNKPFSRIFLEKVNNNQSFKFPVLSFNEEATTEFIDFTGTFYDVSNTTNIDCRVFVYCMSHEGLGCTGFYLYSYIKHKNDIYNNGYKATFRRIAKEIGLSESTVQKYMKVLREFNLVKTIHNIEYFSLGLKEEEREASTHKTNEYENFLVKASTYDKLEIKTTYEHYQIEKERWKANTEHLIDFKVEDLPF